MVVLGYPIYNNYITIKNNHLIIKTNNNLAQKINYQQNEYVRIKQLLEIKPIQESNELIEINKDIVSSINRISIFPISKKYLKQNNHILLQLNFKASFKNSTSILTNLIKQQYYLKKISLKKENTANHLLSTEIILLILKGDIDEK